MSNEAILNLLRSSVSFILAPSTMQEIIENNLREWQHEILRKYGKVSCYALFLVLPSDTEAINYLAHFGQEIHQISGDNVLVVAFSEQHYKIPMLQKNFLKDQWVSIVEEHVAEGLCTKVGNLFEIKYTEFPCLLIFEDIRSKKHIKIGLKDLSEKEISFRMREIFSVIQEAVKSKKNVFSALQKNADFKKLQVKGQATINVIKGLTEKTFEAALTTWAETVIK